MRKQFQKSNASKNQMKTKVIAFALPALGMILPLSAAVTYVDAFTNNTVLETSGAIVFQPTAGFNVGRANDASPPGSDNLWGFRDRSFLNGTPAGVFVAAGTENVTQRLATTIALPSAGIYNISGFFWRNGASGAWDVAFELGTSGETIYTGANATDISGNPLLTGMNANQDGGSATIHLFQASLGQWNTAVNGLNVTVFVNDATNPTGVTDGRTWYDGVGYELVPEPSAALLSCLGLLFAIGRRSRKI